MKKTYLLSVILLAGPAMAADSLDDMFDHAFDNVETTEAYSYGYNNNYTGNTAGGYGYYRRPYAAWYQPYLGTYMAQQANVTFQIGFDGRSLVAQIPGRGSFPLQPINAVMFTSPQAPDARIQFIMDSYRRVTGLVLTKGSFTIQAVKVR